MGSAKPAKTLSVIFEEFLADQKARIGQQTFSKYETIIHLYKSYLERYWPGHEDETANIMKTGGTYCGTFGAEDATAGFGMFLDYFMTHKVMCGQGTLKAAGPVTKKLAKWLVKKGYVADTEYEQERAGAAAKDLPKTQKILTLLDDYLDENAPGKYSEKIEDHFTIERIEPGKLWLMPLTRSSVIGPVPVPEAVTKLCRPQWDIGGVVAKVGQGWRLIEVWNVSP